MTAVLAVIATFAVAFYSIRIHVKFNIMKKLGWDDCEFTLHEVRQVILTKLFSLLQ